MHLVKRQGMSICAESVGVSPKGHVPHHFALLQELFVLLPAQLTHTYFTKISKTNQVNGNRLPPKHQLS